MVTDKGSVVLIVDDNPHNLQILGGIIEENGYEYILAMSGKDALESITIDRPDLILLDVMMPEMDGYETCRLIKANELNKDIPIIFISALNEMENKIKGFDAGGVDYITKPFYCDEVMARVRTHLLLKYSTDALREREATLVNMIGARDKFISIISHDLKNPITALTGITEILRIKAKKHQLPDIIEASEHINNSSQRLHKIILELLEWSTFQKEGFVVATKNISLHKIVQEEISLYKDNLDSKKIGATIDISVDLYVYADEMMLKTIIRNLLSNAIKFSFENSEILIYAVEHTTSHQCICIKDNGIGMAPETVTKLFKIQHHISTEGTLQETGTGLGLILCGEMVEKNNGSIWAESVQGKGTTFKFTVPKAQ